MAPPAPLTIVVGDLTTQRVDAIVNAANESLLGGGGLDGAIHRAAGPELLSACLKLGGCPTGEARLTPGFKLPARWVIHAVGPVWRGGTRGEDELLASCHRASLELARECGARTVAFPAISTGAYRFPRERAAEIALRTTREWLAERLAPIAVTFCCFTEDAAEVYREALRALGDRATG
jgi:O-acetyl-ADP-ribose deacetylase (regulator of RNase III)